MSLATIGSNFLKSLDIEGNFSSQITFNNIFADLITDSGKLLFGAILDSLSAINFGISADLDSSGMSDSVDVTKGIY